MTARRRICPIAALLLVSLCMLAGCAGEDGATGPVGPAGNDGADGIDGTDGTDGVDGRPGLVWRGIWSPSTTYLTDDAVYHEGSSYISLVDDNTGQTPPAAYTKDAYWGFLSIEGAPGVWDGGRVGSEVTFDGGAVFSAGTVVDFSGAEVTGIPMDWTGGEVADPVTFHDAVDIDMFSPVMTLHHPDGSVAAWRHHELVLDDESDALMVLQGGTTPELELTSDYSSQVILRTEAGGEAALRMTGGGDPDPVIILGIDMPDGGGAVFELLGPSADFIWDTNTGTASFRNQDGETTIEFNAKTGDIVYTGSLIKK